MTAWELLEHLARCPPDHPVIVVHLADDGRNLGAYRVDNAVVDPVGFTIVVSKAGQGKP